MTLLPARLKHGISEHAGPAGCLIVVLLPVIIPACIYFPKTQFAASAFTTIVPAATGVSIAAFGYSVVWLVRFLWYGEQRILKGLLLVGVLSALVAALVIGIFGSALIRGSLSRKADFFNRFTETTGESGADDFLFRTLQHRKSPCLLVALPKVGFCDVVVRNRSSDEVLLCYWGTAWPRRFLYPSWKPWLCFYPLDELSFQILSLNRQEVAIGETIRTNRRMVYALAPGAEVTYMVARPWAIPQRPLYVFWYDAVNEVGQWQDSAAFLVRVDRRQTTFGQYALQSGTKVAFFLGNGLALFEVFLCLLWIKKKASTRSIRRRTWQVISIGRHMDTSECERGLRRHLGDSAVQQLQERALALRREGAAMTAVGEYLHSQRKRFSLKLRTSEAKAFQEFFTQYTAALTAQMTAYETEERAKRAVHRTRLRIEKEMADLSAEHHRAQEQEIHARETAKLERETEIEELKTHLRLAKESAETATKIAQLEQQKTLQELQNQLCELKEKGTDRPKSEPREITPAEQLDKDLAECVERRDRRVADGKMDPTEIERIFEDERREILRKFRM